MLPNVDPPRDYFGREIKVGDTVVYGVYTRNGSLNSGVVDKLTVKGDIARRFVNDWGKWDSKMVPNWKITIVTNSTKWDAATRSYVPCPRKQTLDTPTRFAIVEAPNDRNE